MFDKLKTDVKEFLDRPVPLGKVILVVILTAKICSKPKVVVINRFFLR